MIRTVVLDLETTGLSPFKGDRVIEIGALAIERGEVLHTFQTLVNVRKKIPRHASKVHGITDDMLFGQPFPEEVLILPTKGGHSVKRLLVPQTLLG